MGRARRDGSEMLASFARVRPMPRLSPIAGTSLMLPSEVAANKREMEHAAARSSQARTLPTALPCPGPPRAAKPVPETLPVCGRGCSLGPRRLSRRVAQAGPGLRRARRALRLARPPASASTSPPGSSGDSSGRERDAGSGARRVGGAVGRGSGRAWRMVGVWTCSCGGSGVARRCAHKAGGGAWGGGGRRDCVPFHVFPFRSRSAAWLALDAVPNFTTHTHTHHTNQN